MATPTRRGLILPISAAVQLNAKDDLDGTAGTRLSIDCTGATRVIVIQEPALEAGDGTAGIDVVVISKDGGSTWTLPTDGLLISADDGAGTVLVGAALNAAGAEPTTARGGTFKFGPYEGPTLLRVCRKTSSLGSAVTWVTHAPAVNAFLVGGTSGTPTSITHTSD